jgi:F-type H+-transporting ATPase subunit delta
MADFGAIARPYAKAIFDVAVAGGKLAEWSTALNAAAAVVQDAGAKRVLADPSTDAAKRAEFIGAVAAGIHGAALLASSDGKGLLALLAENDRIAALPEIAAQFDALKSQAENKVKVTLTSAVPVEGELAGQITKALERRLGRAVELTLTVDPAMLGGAIIRADDMVIDGSVRTRLQRLTETLAG